MKAALLAVAAVVSLSGQTPPPTTSADCTDTAADTRAFLASPAVGVRAPRGGTLALATVDTNAGRERGLMCVVRVPRGNGMIFVFPGGDAERSFWMKNTLVPLDMVFVTSKGRVTAVAANVPATPAGTPDANVESRKGVATFVIELGAGDAARHGIEAGSTLALPPLNAKE